MTDAVALEPLAVRLGIAGTTPVTLPMDILLADEELRANHEFVMAPESLRRAHGFREMSDAALVEIAEATGLPFSWLPETSSDDRHG